MYYIYQLRLECSAIPFYIGKGKNRRMYEHFTPKSLKGDSHKNRIIRKAMRDGVKVIPEILHTFADESLAFIKEVELIAFYGRRINGGCLTNATDGGEGSSGYKPSAESIEKSARAKRGKPRDAETKKKLSEAASRRRHASETRRKISKSNTGKSRDSTQKMNIQHGKWNSSPEWKIADVLHVDWINSGKPGRTNFQKSQPGINVMNIQRAFARGWIPNEDPNWLTYKAL